MLVEKADMPSVPKKMKPFTEASVKNYYDEHTIRNCGESHKVLLVTKLSNKH